ncbi:phospholipase C/alpha-toxin [Anaerobacterium chartisolvens]|uniref:Phospholipase C n=1 Tax=Anaerobacterium chartisolvens TaxID=1297424 RepID=A0A369AEU1_9FIRM|nr:PLAT/LH2 domain-containing protein [Anaerobacterium chartisolvens]RCX07872.1 phospholipase C/alpha-toxin [Anaerobacterium chartisolvens]
MLKSVKLAICCIIPLSIMLSAALYASAWQSSGSNPATKSSTHEFIVERALQIIENDLGSEVSSDSNFLIIKNRLSRLKMGSTAPDNLKNVALGGLTESDWWSSHFYDPDTGKNYSRISPYIHAEYQTRRFIKIAVSDFNNGNYDAAVYKLGYASHFFADLCVPHHAANNTALDKPYNHSNFEDFAQSMHHNYAVYTAAGSGGTASELYSEADSYSTIDSFITSKANYYGKISKNYFFSNCNPGTTDTWNTAASETIKNSQTALALIYYRFLQELKHSKKLSIRVKTANVLLAGTDDDIYFGMQMPNGYSKEFLLDKTTDILGGIYGINLENDFEQGNNDVYNFYINDSDFDFGSVSSCWIRKSQYMGVASDWKLESIEIEVDDQFVSSRYFNKWYSGNVTDSWSVNGLVPGAVIGRFDVTIKTADALWAGTDDDIYFGMEMGNGSAVEYLLDKSGYNDFERNKTDTYILTCNDPQFSAPNITSVWIRKKSLLNDDWKFYSIAITMNGAQVFYQVPNEWMYGSTTYKMPVNGF